MRKVVVLIGVAAILAAAAPQGGEPARCSIHKGLYEERQALASDPGGAAANGESAASGGATATAQRASLDREYARFFQGLSEAADSGSPTAIAACCTEAAEDRVGALACHLVAYLASGRTDNATFLSVFPSARKDAATLWDLDAIAASAASSHSPVPKAFQPKGPGYRYIDELFLLVLDGNEDAIVKYFGLADLASGEYARYMEEKLELLVREAPATLLTNWFVIRKHKARIKTVIQTFLASATPAETQRVTQAVRTLCGKDDPDCQEILHLFPKK